MKKYSFIIPCLLLTPTLYTWAQPPNIVIVIGDDCTYRDIGCYGSKDAITPNIDKLASEGIKFNNFYQATAMCSPTRHCLMTGLYPVKSGAYPNHTRVNEGTKSIVHYLRDAGYRVALQGKRHIMPRESFPFEYLGEGNEDVKPKKIDKFIGDAKSNNQPFCLFVCSHDPHSPWTKGDRSKYDPDKITLPPYFVDTKETRKAFCNYLAEVNVLDGQVGAVNSILEKHSIANNTLFIFTSEQGNSFPFAKWTCYTSGLQTAFIVRWPEKIKAGSESNAICEYVDVVPTLLDVVGVEAIPGLDGESFAGVLTGKKEKHKDYTFSVQTSRGIYDGPECYGIRSVRDKRYRYVINLSPEVTFKCTINNNKNTFNLFWGSWIEKTKSDIDAQHLVSRFEKRPAEEFYDLDSDPFEMKNLINDPSYKEDILRLKRILENWMKSQGDKGQETEMKAIEFQVRS